jgi:hypothetical protein
MTEAPLTTFFARPRQQALLLAATWNACEHLHHELAAAFYSRFLARLPGAKQVFPEPTGVHVARLASVIGLTLAHIDRPGHVQATLAGAGRRLSDLGFETSYYPVAMGSLREACAEVFGAEYTLDHDAACEVLGREAVRWLSGSQPGPLQGVANGGVARSDAGANHHGRFA